MYMKLFVPLSIATLPESSACVNVGPPFACSGPNFNCTALTPDWSGGPKLLMAAGGEASPKILNPSD